MATRNPSSGHLLCRRTNVIQQLDGLSLRSRRRRRAWGVSPRDTRDSPAKPVTTGDSRSVTEIFRPLARALAEKPNLSR